MNMRDWHAREPRPIPIIDWDSVDGMTAKVFHMVPVRRYGYDGKVWNTGHRVAWMKVAENGSVKLTLQSASPNGRRYFTEPCVSDAEKHIIRWYKRTFIYAG